jgi:hypothetical protein
MLRKLIKYDLKYGAKIFIIIHALLIISCVLGRLLFVNKLDFSNSNSVLFSYIALFMTMFILIFTAINLAVIAMVAIRFYRNLFSDEGYLTWTLPATSTEQLWAKIISGTFWYILDMLIITLSLFILITGKNVTTAYAKIAPDITNALGMPLGTWGFYLLVICLFTSISGVVSIYLCIAVGQLFPGHRVLCSIIIYFVLSAVLQIIILGLMIALGLFSSPYMDPASTGKDAVQYLFSILKLSGLVAFISTIIEYLIIQYILSRKINLI